VEALGEKGDIAIGISTSGKSANVLKGIEECKQKGVFTIGFLGCKGGEIGKRVDLALVVPSENTPRIQESHITIGHIICNLVEKELFA
jgi:D-sedoheptulose 7-phosphate isomerase